jgi:hypothetical protein
MKNALLTTTLVLVGMAITPAQATTYTFSWVTPSNTNTDLGLLYSLSNNGITLTARGLTAPANLTNAAAAGPDLYAKNGGTGETGLGMATDPGGDHEISAKLNDGIQVDFSDALSKAPNATVSMVIESAQVGEGWALYGSNTLLTVAGNSKSDGALGEPLLSGAANYPNATTSITIPDWGQYTYYTLMATDANCKTPLANILLGTVTITPGTTQNPQAPEPGTLMMGGTALIGLGVVWKKKQKKA